MSVMLGGLSPEDKAALQAAQREETAKKDGAAQPRYFYNSKTGRTATVLPGQDPSQYLNDPRYSEISRERLRELRQSRNPERQLEDIQRRYRAGEVSAHDVALAADEILRLQGVEEQRMITEAPKGMYYQSAQEVSEYNRRVVEYNREVRKYRQDLVESLLRGEEAPRPPAAYGTVMERDPDILSPGPEEEPVRTVLDTRSPTMPSEELSLMGYDVPPDVRPTYSQGRPPSDLELAMGVGRTPARLLRDLEAGLLFKAGSLPGEGEWRSVRQGLHFLGRAAGTGADLVDPLFWMSLPAVTMAGATYLTTAGLDRIASDALETGEEYVSTRLASPELLAGDVGSVLVSTAFLKGVGKAGGAVGRQLSKLPGEPMRAGRLAVISGESPIPFKTAFQLSGVSDALGGLTAWRTLPRFLKLKGVNLGELSLERPMPGVGVVGAATGMAPLPFRQAWEITRQYGGVKVPTPGLIRFLGIPGVTTALPRAVWHIPGSSFAKFMLMPGAVEPWTGRVAYTPRAFTSKDISGLLQIKAWEQAEIRAGNLEAFMRSTFTEPRGPVKGAPDTSAATLIQMGQRAAQGTGEAFGVFPFTFTAMPRGVLLEKPDVKVSMRPVQDTAAKMDRVLRDAADVALKPVQLSKLKLEQPQLLKQLQAVDTVLKPMTTPTPRLAQAPIITPLLTTKQVTQQTQKQATRQALVPIFNQTMRQSPAERRLLDQLKGRPAKKGRTRRKSIYELRTDFKVPSFKLPETNAKNLLKPVRVPGLEPKKKRRRK